MPVVKYMVPPFVFKELKTLEVITGLGPGQASMMVAPGMFISVSHPNDLLTLMVMSFGAITVIAMEEWPALSAPELS